MNMAVDQRIQTLIDETKTKFGLEDYDLARHELHREVNMFNETVYTLSMEWFPKHVQINEDADFNPDGTAVIEIELHSKRYKHVIFVGGKCYANGIKMERINLEEVIKWIERETGFTYGKQFLLRKEQERKYQFHSCVNGVFVSPGGSIEIEFDSSGNLILFTVDGQFPAPEMVKEETYTLTMEKIENIAKSQLKLVEFPITEKETFCPVYAVEEIYVTNDRLSTIPFEEAFDGRPHIKIDKTMYWESPANQSYIEQKIKFQEDITAEQAFMREPSPDSKPISKADQEQCIHAVQILLSQKYTNDSGKWILKTLHRDMGYIHATLTKIDEKRSIFQRKLTVIIDPNRFQPVNFIDNKPMIEMFNHYQKSEKVTITKEEAYEKLKDKFELKPCYVYNFDEKKYVLCGKLDCQYGVYATNGDIVSLDGLL